MGIITKASQRANGQELAVHLQNARDNERVEIVHIRGAVAQDLSGAFQEWHAISKATKCRKYLYSLSLNPDPTQGPLTRRQYKDYIARVENKLKLRGHPRAIVFHVKEGREHCHVVWSRIIPGQLKAVPISHDRLALQAITRDFAKDHNLILPENMQPGSDTKDRPLPVRMTLFEKHQQERTGVSREERIEQLTRIWRQTKTGKEFVHAMALAGYHLARGDSVPYAVLDHYGEIHSLPRQIEGAKTKDIRARLVDCPPESLPPATLVRDSIRRKLSATIATQFNRNAETPWIQLKDAQSKRRAIFHTRILALKEKQQDERWTLMRGQRLRLLGQREERLRDNARGFMAVLCAIPGISGLIARHQRKQDLASITAFREERRAMLVCQKLQFEDLKRQLRAIVRVEKRESRSLKTSLRRAFLRSRIEGEFIAAAGKPVAANSDEPQITAKAELTTILASPRDVRATAGKPSKNAGIERLPGTAGKDSLSAVFSPAIQEHVPQARAAFQRAASPPQKAFTDQFRQHGPR